MKSFRYNKTTIATPLPADTLLTVSRRLSGRIWNADGSAARNEFECTLEEGIKNGWLSNHGGDMSFDAEISASETRFSGPITLTNNGRWVVLNEG